MSPLEIKRLKLELVKVSAAKAELEFRIEERLEDIARLRDNISIQENREKELQDKIDEASK